MADITTTTTTSAATKTAPGQKKNPNPGLTFKRFFTTAGVSPYDELEWELRTAQITDSNAGMTVPEASTIPSTGPRSTLPVRISARATEGRNHPGSSRRTITTSAIDPPPQAARS